MSPRHRRRTSRLRRRLTTGTLVLFAVGAATAVVMSADPPRPTLDPSISDPAMFAEGQDPALAGAPLRTPRVSRSSVRGGESAAPRPTTAAPPASPRPTPSTAPPRQTTAAPTPVPATPVRSTMEDQVLALVNAERGEAGCGPVHLDAKLRQAAQGHSQDMADNDYFDHTGADGSSPWDRAEAAGYDSPSGENIAAGYQTAEAVMDGWMNSDGHRANILNCDSKAMGLGYVADSSRGPLWTQLFGFV